MGGHTKMDDLPSFVVDYKPGVQQSEPNGRDHEKVHCGNPMPVIVKKRLPPLALMVVGISLREISRDGGKPNRDPKLRKFSPDLSGAPAVLSCESANEGLYVSRNGRTPGSAPRNRSPVEAESLAMPSDDGLGLNDDQNIFPPGPHS